MRFHSSTGASSTGPSSIVPALFTKVSSRPSSATVRSTTPPASSSSVRSAPSESAVPPSALIVSVSVSKRSVRRAARATAAPRLASASAAASPIPLEAPVTSATVPSSVSAEPGSATAALRVCAHRYGRRDPLAGGYVVEPPGEGQRERGEPDQARAVDLRRLAQPEIADGRARRDCGQTEGEIGDGQHRGDQGGALVHRSEPAQHAEDPRESGAEPQARDRAADEKQEVRLHRQRNQRHPDPRDQRHQATPSRGTGRGFAKPHGGYRAYPGHDEDWKPCSQVA